MKVWGLTGNIACGKSAVERLLRDAGLPVIDADVVAREVVEPGQPALVAIEQPFGKPSSMPTSRPTRKRMPGRQCHPIVPAH